MAKNRRKQKLTHNPPKPKESVIDWSEFVEEPKKIGFMISTENCLYDLSAPMPRPEEWPKYKEEKENSSDVVNYGEKLVYSKKYTKKRTGCGRDHYYEIEQVFGGGIYLGQVENPMIGKVAMVSPGESKDNILVPLDSIAPATE